jgi:hypothetical protein
VFVSGNLNIDAATLGTTITNICETQHGNDECELSVIVPSVNVTTFISLLRHLRQGATTISITTLSIMDLLLLLSITISSAECHYGKCYFAKCLLYFIMLSVTILNVTFLC